MNKRFGLLAMLALLLGLCFDAQAAETVTLYLTNALGTPVAEMDASGSVTYTAADRPYGKQQMGAVQAGPGFTGHVNDVDTGLVYMQARYYDQVTGRFLTVDPVGPAPGDVFGFGRYTYANDNPVRYTDPDGRCPQDVKQCFEATPPSFFRDWWVGRFLSSTVGNTVALFTKDNLNPLNDQYVGPHDLQEAKLGILTLAIPAAKPEAAALDVAKEALPAIKVGSSGGETAGKAFSQAVKDAARVENPGAVCVYCRMEGTGTQVDHVIPRARGGNATVDNAQLACPHCNASKGARDFPVNPPPGYRGEWPPPHWNQQP